MEEKTILKNNNDLSNTEQEETKKNKEIIIVKSNKCKKIELKNLFQIEQIEKSEQLDEWTKNKLSLIKNITFKNNVFDIEKKLIVSSIRLIKTSKLGKRVTPMVWEYYKNRGNLDVNEIINKYSRECLIINYSINPMMNKKIKSDENEIK